MKNHSNSTYKKHYGYRTLMDYLQQNRDDSRRIGRPVADAALSVPAHVKNGTSLFLQFLDDLDFGDEVGLVGYGEWAVQAEDVQRRRRERRHLQRSDHAELQRRSTRSSAVTRPASTTAGRRWATASSRPASCWSASPAIRTTTATRRYGARPTMIVMTDGQTNQKPSSWSLPASFKWKDWTDYDGDGMANYTTSDNYKKYAFWEATEAIKRGITIHTIAVGADADRDLMKAIAFAGGGVFIDVPGGSTVAANGSSSCSTPSARSRRRCRRRSCCTRSNTTEHGARGQLTGAPAPCSKLPAPSSLARVFQRAPPRPPA